MFLTYQLINLETTKINFMREITLLFFIIFSISCAAQKPKQKFNLDFEKVKKDQNLSDGWFKWGNYHLSRDSVVVYSGNYSAKIDGVSGNSFGSIAYKIPSKYKGKTITLEGYMKLKNVSGGHAGLLMRLDTESEALQFDNMQAEGIDGTLDWKKYKISLPFDEKTESIYVAGILVGSGKVWFDQFTVSIDGKNIQTLKEIEKEKTKGELDNLFNEGSSINFPKLTDKKLDDLELLGKVWGFLKYHHPAIATGDYNWDYELFRMLPNYLETTTEENRNQVLLNWIESYGEIKKCTACKPINPKAFLKPNFQWFNQHNLSEQLSKRLNYIQKNRTQGKHYYIKFARGIGNPKFVNEKNYSNMPFPDAGFRLLTLFRYWNMIEYYFPYKHLTDNNWKDVLRNYITRFVHAEKELSYELATLELIGELNDTHANLWGGNNAIREWKGSYYPPFHVRFIENKAVVVDYYNPELQKLSKIEVGDIITAINNKPVEAILKEIKNYYPASNYPTQLRDIGENLLRSQDSIISIAFKRSDSLKKHKLPLYKSSQLNNYSWYKAESNDKSYKWLDNNIAYITLKNIKEEDIKPLKKEFINAKGIIIDIRNYPSYFVPFALGQYFVDKFTPFARFTTANDKTPGEFILNNGVKIPPKGEQFKGKLVVLVNELSQSQAEYTAMAFRATPNCTIIGSTTAGADGNVSNISLPGGMNTMISGIGVHYPDGSETQRIGIVPDIEIKPTIKGIKQGIDELLEKAIEIINSN